MTAKVAMPPTTTSVAPVPVERSQARLPSSPRMTQAMNDLLAAGPSNETPEIVNEILDAEKRGTSYLALIPLFGPWLLRRSDVHSAAEKRKLSAVSIAITLVLLAIIWMLLPTRADHLAALRLRIGNELRTLGEVAEQHRATRGAYPDVTTWKRFAARADPRFFDPWARPYVYEPDGDGVTLRTLGRDGIAGGNDENADVSRFFPKK